MVGGGTHLEERLRPNRQPHRPTNVTARCATSCSTPSLGVWVDGWDGMGVCAMPCHAMQLCLLGGLTNCGKLPPCMHPICTDGQRGAYSAVHPRASFTRRPSQPRPLGNARVPTRLTKHISSKYDEMNDLIDFAIATTTPRLGTHCPAEHCALTCSAKTRTPLFRPCHGCSALFLTGVFHNTSTCRGFYPSPHPNPGDPR